MKYRTPKHRKILSGNAQQAKLENLHSANLNVHKIQHEALKFNFSCKCQTMVSKLNSEENFLLSHNPRKGLNIIL